MALLGKNDLLLGAGVDYWQSRLLFSSLRAHISEIISAVGAHILSLTSPVFGTSANIHPSRNYRKCTRMLRGTQRLGRSRYALSRSKTLIRTHIKIFGSPGGASSALFRWRKPILRSTKPLEKFVGSISEGETS